MDIPITIERKKNYTALIVIREVRLSPKMSNNFLPGYLSPPLITSQQNYKIVCPCYTHNFIYITSLMQPQLAFSYLHKRYITLPYYLGLPFSILPGSATPNRTFRARLCSLSFFFVWVVGEDVKQGVTNRSCCNLKGNLIAMS